MPSFTLLRNGVVVTTAMLILSATTGIVKAETRLPQASGQPVLVAQMPMSMGSTFFNNPPALGPVSVSQSVTYGHGEYQFTITVPADAGQALQAVRISQDPNLETLDFNANHSRAFTGTHYSTATAVPLASVGGATEAPGEVTIAFAQPIQPGQTVTIRLTADRNPIFGGVYNFGVTAYPVGNQTQGQYIGTGRVNFYGSDH